MSNDKHDGEVAVAVSDNALWEMEPDHLLPHILAWHRRVEDKATEAIEAAYQLGRLLRTTKEKLGHGRWGDWAAKNLPFSQRYAQQLMRLADHWPQVQEANTKRASFLSVRTAIEAAAELGRAARGFRSEHFPEALDYLDKANGCQMPRVSHIPIDRALRIVDERRASQEGEPAAEDPAEEEGTQASSRVDGLSRLPACTPDERQEVLGKCAEIDAWLLDVQGRLPQGRADDQLPEAIVRARKAVRHFRDCWRKNMYLWTHIEKAGGDA